MLETREASRVRRMRGPLLVAGGVALASAVVVLADPNTPGHYPVCPTKLVTGLDCPFCGGLRCAHSLLTGDVAGALDHNALVVALVPLAVIAWLVWAWSAWTGKPLPAWRLSANGRRALLWSTVALLVAWTVVRNIPAGYYFASGLA